MPTFKRKLIQADSRHRVTLGADLIDLTTVYRAHREDDGRIVLTPLNLPEHD